MRGRLSTVELDSFIDDSYPRMRTRRAVMQGRFTVEPDSSIDECSLGQHTRDRCGRSSKGGRAGMCGAQCNAGNPCYRIRSGQ